MKKRFRDTEVWKLLRVLLELTAIILTILALIHACEWFISEAHAEKEPEARWVFCNDILLVREGPKKTYMATGELDPGTMVWTDGKIRNGYCHLVNLANESGDGWVKNVYLTDEEPLQIDREARVISKGRLAARRTVNGELRKWLKPDSTVTVYWITDEWAVTSQGYVMLKYLEFN